MVSADFNWIEANTSDLLVGGEAGALIRANDWSKTARALIESCSSSIRMMVSFLPTGRNGTAAGKQ